MNKRIAFKLANKVDDLKESDSVKQNLGLLYRAIKKWQRYHRKRTTIYYLTEGEN